MARFPLRNGGRENRMSALQWFAQDFDAAVQARGREYHASGAVAILRGREHSIRANVQGGRRYRVRIEWGHNDVSYDCTCPFFRENDAPCKHLWATLLQAEQENLLPNLSELEAMNPQGRDRNPAPKATPDAAQPTPPWKQQLSRLRVQMESAPPDEVIAPWPVDRRIVYIVEQAASVEGGLTVQLGQERITREGRWERATGLTLSPQQISRLPEPTDRQILQMLFGVRSDESYPIDFDDEAQRPRRFVLPDSALDTTFRLICQTGRCRMRKLPPDDVPTALQWDDGGAWEFWLEIKTSPGGRNYVLDGSLRRGEERMDLAEPVIVLPGGLVFTNTRVAPLVHFGAFPLLRSLRDGLKLAAPLEQRDELMRTLFALPRLPKLEVPEEMRFEELRPTPQPRILIRKPSRGGWEDDRLVAELSFDYAGQVIPAREPAHSIVAPDAPRVLFRDGPRESAAAGRLLALGFREEFSYASASGPLRLAPSRLPKVVQQLTAEGWLVEAEGKLYRQPGELRLQVSSGIDWFELHGSVQFGEHSASLPELLKAMQRGENSIRLDDGTVGLLPDEWLQRYASLVGMGEAVDEHLRFSKRQIGFLDALLSAMPESRFDETFARARDELMRFEGVEALDEPAGFVGELRGYQREGLGWMAFLRRFGFGGCLADDMGLGKTVQVLALLEARRQIRASAEGNGDAPAHADRPSGPSLVVAPRSLVFNWIQEAARFTPALRVLDHTSADRSKDAAHFENYDVVLTTYGTLRRDAGYFRDITFDYVVLDEAQAIKNAASESAKATRLLRASHRLALSGTPVQNHLGELWSLFEFLNPGMMGSASVFRDVGATSGKEDPASRSLLGKALRPFILRRTKEQVARDLPAKFEQTLFCELEPPQRKLYDELRDHYRATLFDRIAREGINKAKIHVLEALLRLRQAACHPGLIDKSRANEGSAKVDTLLMQIEEVIDEDHKVLVFSQFTSLLALVRQRLDASKTVYEYLDGKTRDRQQRVERFQNDPDCKLFLISLKAGGLGLNLTAAEYVYLLDPWWNPAVEAQAIDRAHRIGQTRQVFAYRLIAKDTVEEKVLQLQQTKRDLADAILSADNSLIRDLGREDLELLLS